MKTDSERQAAYQERRLERQTRITFWLPKEDAQLMERLNGGNRSGFLKTAVKDLICRRLLDDAPLTADEIAEARMIGEETFRVSLSQ